MACSRQFEMGLKVRIEPRSESYDLRTSSQIDVASQRLVPRMSSLLSLYSGIQEAVRQSEWLFVILGRKFDLRGVNDLFTYSEHHLQLISEIQRITNHFIFEAAVKVSRICNLGPFSLQTNQAYFHINKLADPRLLFKYRQNDSNKVLKVFFQFLHSSSAELAPEQQPFSVAWRCLDNGEIHNGFQICPFSGQIRSKRTRVFVRLRDQRMT